MAWIIFKRTGVCRDVDSHFHLSLEVDAWLQESRCWSLLESLKWLGAPVRHKRMRQRVAGGYTHAEHPGISSGTTSLPTSQPLKWTQAHLPNRSWMLYRSCFPPANWPRLLPQFSSLLSSLICIHAILLVVCLSSSLHLGNVSKPVQVCRNLV